MATSKRLLRSGREKGSVAVEMAVIAPLLVLMVAGILDLGLLYWEQEVLTNAAREGARAGARAITDLTGNGRAQKTTTEVRTIVQSYLQNNNIKDASGSDIVLTPSNCTYTWAGTNPATITVQLINIPVKLMMLPNAQKLFSGAGISSEVNLNASITMAAEWVTPPGS